MEIKDVKILIIEDELDKREFLFRTLTDAGIPINHIKRASHTKTAVLSIKENEPDVILLDISIPREENGIAEPENVSEILDKIRLFNLENIKKIRTIIISGTVKQKVIQEIIGTMNKMVVFDFIDKVEIAKDIQTFKQNLVLKIQKAMNTDFPPQKIDYSSIISSKVKELKQYNEPLWGRIKKEILDEFEKLDEDNINEQTTAKNIIGSCGQIVEIIVNLIENNTLKGVPRYSQDNIVSLRKRLTTLSGREYDLKNHKYNTIRPKGEISRKVCEYGSEVLSLRNYVYHPPEGDKENRNIYADSNISKEDAAISINLLVPVIIEYIKYINRK